MAGAFPYKLYDGALRPNAISGFDARFNSALTDLYNRAPPEVRAELALSSGFRDYDTQKALFEASDRTGRTVARPGHSKHEKGTAADLYGFGLKGKAKPVSQATRDWVHANAKQSGLYFPMDYEPWHIQLLDEQMKDAGYTPEQRRAALLSATRQLESSNRYDIRYDSRGGTPFDMTKGHPNVRVPIMKNGMPTGSSSSAAGAYQFIEPTWARLSKQYNLADMSPANQDIAAWQLAAEQYGGEEALIKALEGDPLAVAAKLGGQWEALAKNPAKFAELYNAALGGGGGGSSGGVSSPSGAPLPRPSPIERDDPMSGFAAGMANAGKQKVADVRQAPAPMAQPGIPLPAQPYVDPMAGENRRALLAQMLQRLNTGQII